MVTLKNECIFLQNEIYHLENIKISHLNRVKIMAGNVNNLSRQDRIEQLAFDNFELHIPAPESLIILWDQTLLRLESSWILFSENIANCFLILAGL